MRGTVPELHRKLVWITFFRIAADSVLLAATAFNAVREPAQLFGEVAPALFGLVIGVYALSLVFVGWLRAGRKLVALAYAQVVGDVLVASALVYMTGGYDSPFTFVYSLAVVDAGLLLFRRGAVFGAVGSSVALAALVAGMQRGLIPPAASFLAPEPVATGRLVYLLIVNASAFFLLAALVSYLAEMARQSGEKLQEREIDFATLAAVHEHIVQSVPNGILTIDAEGRILFMNPEAERLLGADLLEVSGLALSRRFAALDEAMARSATGRAEAQLTDASGSTHPVLVRHSSLSGPTGGRVLVLEDLTHVRAMEETLRKSERLAALGKMAAGLAHEIRNPLASMTGSIELLSKITSANADERRLMDIVLREAERLDLLVSDFLAYARPNPPQLQPVNMADLARETMQVFSHDKSAVGVRLEDQMESALWTTADPGQMRQVLWNLLVNAAQSMPGGGAVRIGGARANSSVRVVIADSGEGIPAGDMARIFEPFFTTKDRGTGLGLATVHRILEAHGGHIEVESQPGSGARFCIVLPAVP